MSRRRLPSLPAALVVVAGLGLVARLHALGARPMHWDEARVGFWTLEYATTGAWSYHPVLHGPFLFHVNRRVFGLLGPTDPAARLVVALVGGLLPLSAWLFRRHLSDDEVVALAGLLAATPLLVYYSRFMRNDVPLAAFVLVGFGLAVRASDTGRGRYVVAAGAAIGLGFTTKENAVLYLLAWLGAVLLYVASPSAGFRPDSPPASRQAIEAGTDALRAGVRRWWRPGIAAGLAWLAIVAFAYAPRAGAAGGVGIGRVTADPSVAPAVLAAATVGAARELVSYWLLGGVQSVGIYTPLYFLHLVAVALLGGLAICLSAAVGVVHEVRGRSRPRAVVAVAALWGGLSLIGYPLATDFAAPWIAVHVVVPFAIPAAVGLAALVRRARGRAVAGVPGRSRVAAVVLAGLVLHTAVVGVATTYAAPAHPFNPLAQPAQAGGDIDDTVRAVARVACDDGPTVLYYGDYFRPGTIARRLPLAWYVSRSGATAAFARDPAAFPPDPPPVVVALDSERSFLDPRLDGYRVAEHELDPWVPREPSPLFTEAVVYVGNATACG